MNLKLTAHKKNFHLEGNIRSHSRQKKIFQHAHGVKPTAYTSHAMSSPQRTVPKRIQTLSTFANVPLNSSSVPRTLMRFSRNSTRYHWETSNVSCVLLNCSEFPENRGGMYRSILSPRSPDLGFFLAVGFGLSRAALRTAQMAHTDAPVRPSYGLFSNLYFCSPAGKCSDKKN